MITGKLYDYLKWLAQVVLPAVGALYVALAGLWGLPAAEAVAGTILAVDTFLGVVLGISQVSYAKDVAMVGDMIVHEKEGGGTVHTLQIDSDKDLEDLEEKREVRFRVQKRKPTTRRRPGA
jgi:hypothetical protein